MNEVQIPAYLLAGGQSRRFGSDKARAKIGGQTQLLRLSQALQQQCKAVYVVADSEQRYADLGITCLVDAATERGPAAGLLTALRHRLSQQGAGWLLCVGCDQLLWKTLWLDELQAAAFAQVPKESDFERPVEVVTLGVMHEQNAVAPQPLPALYHTSTLPALSRCIAQTRTGVALKDVLSEVKAVQVKTPDHPRDWSFNTQEELAELLARTGL